MFLIIYFNDKILVKDKIHSLPTGEESEKAIESSVISLVDLLIFEIDKNQGN